jgi:hypothetical protein
MQKSIDKIRSLSKEMYKNWLPDLEEINLHKIFEPIYRLNFNISNINSIIGFIVLAYDNDSSWLNLKQDRYDNKIKILRSLTEDYRLDQFEEIAKNENDSVNEVIGEYLIEQTTWKWQQIMTALDFHSNTLRFVRQKMETEKKTDKMNKEGVVKELTEDYDIDLLAKFSKQKGELLKQALDARRDADSLLSEIRKEFVQMDNAVQTDFNFSPTDEKRINPESWRDFIRERNKRKTTT